MAGLWKGLHRRRNDMLPQSAIRRLTALRFYSAAARSASTRARSASNVSPP